MEKVVQVPFRWLAKYPFPIWGFGMTDPRSRDSARSVHAAIQSAAILAAVVAGIGDWLVTGRNLGGS